MSDQPGVFVAMHTMIAEGCCGGTEILGIFTNEKAAKKCAVAAKKEDGYRGKEAKVHVYSFEFFELLEKF